MEGWQSSTTDDSKTSKGQSKSQPNDTEDDGNLSKKTRSGGRKTSLHRVAIEAQRSRDRLVLRSKGLRFVNPDADTKLVTAYSAAEQYNIYKVADYLRRGHFKVDPYQTGLFPQVVHIQTLGDGFLTYATQQSQNQNETLGDVFIFPSGTMVTWNVPIKTAQYLLELIEPAAKEPHRATMETEDLDFVEDPFQRQSRVIGDTIILGTKVDASNDIIESTHRHAGKEDEATTEDQRPTIDIALAKVAFSSGFARSTRLAVLESRLDSLVESTRQIPDLLSTMTRFRRPKRFSRQFVLQKTGELLSLRAQLNLYSELTDSLPDIFWDSRHELGLEGYYDMVGKALDVGQRIKVLNERMDYAQEITTVLRETLNEKHGEFLEWLVILLIFIEVLFELPRFIDDRWPRHSDKTDDSVMRYLEQGLAKK
ncbi:MAG: hypothetical protein M1822_001253 [Bathelium mastoideum]|nr:MAG: hypothetical protein M1822_001253 [Bathelium mastoideum]